MCVRIRRKRHASSKTLKARSTLRCGADTKREPLSLILCSPPKKSLEQHSALYNSLRSKTKMVPLTQSRITARSYFLEARPGSSHKVSLLIRAKCE